MGFARPGFPDMGSIRPKDAVSTKRPPGQAGQGTHDQGFAGPDCGDSDPCSPFAGFRIRVYVFSAAWRTETLDRLPGPGNRHNRS